MERLLLDTASGGFKNGVQVAQVLVQVTGHRVQLGAEAQELPADFWPGGGFRRERVEHLLALGGSVGDLQRGDQRTAAIEPLDARLLQLSRQVCPPVFGAIGKQGGHHHARRRHDGTVVRADVERHRPMLAVSKGRMFGRIVMNRSPGFPRSMSSMPAKSSRCPVSAVCPSSSVTWISSEYAVIGTV